jgi:hypothetical protein
MLTRRLASLVKSGLLERRLYNQRPPRYDYVLTERGRDFRPVILALMTWGNRHFTPEGKSVLLVDARSGKPADPVLTDRLSGKPLTDKDYVLRPGPAAKARIRERYAAG